MPDTPGEPRCRREPARPTNLPELAEACLRALAERGLGDAISLGGALGLLHYCDYRPTHDADAWWVEGASDARRAEVVRTVEETLAAFGPTRTRRWGDVVSVDQLQGKRTVFSFQVARRDAQLEPPAPAPWADVLLDSFADLVASKVTALVERGAPRDFRDVYTLCQAGLTTPAECWALWRQRQEQAGSDTDPIRARTAVETHLARIARHRPLEGIPDEAQRAEAARTRAWFREVFLDAADEG